MRRIGVKHAAVGGVAIIALMVLTTVFLQSRRALQHSHSMVMGRKVTQAIERFVAQHGRWPTSWTELEREHPELTSSSIRDSVAVDFSADITILACQSPHEFDAIRPASGSAENYKEYWQVDTLLDTIRRVRSEAK